MSRIPLLPVTKFILLSSTFLLCGCASTGNISVDMVGDARPPVELHEVFVYQDPPGMLQAIQNADSGLAFERIAMLESTGVSYGLSLKDIGETASGIVSNFKRRSADLGANAVIIREVVITEGEREGQAVPRTLDVRSVEGGYDQYDHELTEAVTRKVINVKIIAESVFMEEIQ